MNRRLALLPPPPPRNRTCPIKAYGSSNGLSRFVALHFSASCSIASDLSCRQCFPSGIDHLLTPSLPLLSQASSLIWVSPTPDVSFASLRSFESLKSHTVSGTRQVSRVCTQYLVRSPRSPTPAEPAHSCLSFAHCCLLCQTPHRLLLFMNYGAQSLHAFALRLSHSSAYA